jgi:endonuclease YncB( thermonuclease family)
MRHWKRADVWTAGATLIVLAATLAGCMLDAGGTCRLNPPGLGRDVLLAADLRTSPDQSEPFQLTPVDVQTFDIEKARADIQEFGKDLPAVRWYDQPRPRPVAEPLTYAPVPEPAEIDPDTKADPVAAEPVPHGVCFAGRIVGVHDGDTLTFQVTTTYQVRLEDCWAPELDEPGGLSATAALTRMAIGETGRLFIPFGKPGFGDETSFNRVVGRVWRKGSRLDLSREMIRAGHATEKEPKRKGKKL